MILLSTTKTRVRGILFVFVILSGPNELIAQEFQIGIIDFYGLNRISVDQARQPLMFEEGDMILRTDGGVRPPVLAESESRLALLPGVASAQTRIICCDQGRATVYVGIEEHGAPTMHFRAPPQGSARLAADILKASDEFSEALIAAVRAGDAMEDQSQGHALAHNPAMRAVQERFVAYADRDLSELRRVLRGSSDASHRALAAQVLGYVDAKQAVVEDLVYAMSDPSVDVRNNAMRALWVFTAATPSAARPVPRVPYEPFIMLLNSPVWSDRNKASVALAELSKGREPELLAKLGNEAITPLVEMARWKSEHGLAAFTILGRIAGYSDEAARAAWRRSEREVVISAALSRH
jgi:hypothetical protein